MSYKKVDGMWEKTEEKVSIHEEAAIYAEMQEALAMQELLVRLEDADLTALDVDMILDIANQLQYGRSVMEQMSEVNAKIGDLPNVSKPVEEVEK